LDHFPYLFAAYSLVWVVIFLYVLSLGRRSKRAEKELESLKRLLESRQTKP
jgi:CcmD family protein